jgi:c(7)-type cytochrome triheme protein
MRNVVLSVMIMFFTFFFISSGTYAVPPGQEVVYDGGGAGKVVFSGKDHRIRGNSCIKCHPDVFIMKGNTKMTMTEMYENKYCGACHNGTESFDAKKKENCKRCHK